MPSNGRIGLAAAVNETDQIIRDYLDAMKLLVPDDGVLAARRTRRALQHRRLNTMRWWLAKNRRAERSA